MSSLQSQLSNKPKTVPLTSINFFVLFVFTFYSLGRQRIVHVGLGERKYEKIEEIVFGMFQLTDTQKQRQRREIFASQGSQIGYLAVDRSHQSNAWLATDSIVTVRERAKNTNGSM